jgi:3-phenylpropionate/cinnamic acid dioxygenase small subunit
MNSQTAAGAGPTVRPRIDVELQIDVEQFLYREAELLDDRRYDDWFALFADDVRYWAPTRANRLRRDRGSELSAPGEVALFDYDKTTLGWRVRQLQTSTHWAEDPPSRTRHLVSNVRIGARSDECGGPGEADRAGELEVRSNFICYRNRLADEVDIWAGERHDRLRRASIEDSWLIARRTIVLDQNVVLSKNLSVFF